MSMTEVGASTSPTRSWSPGRFIGRYDAGRPGPLFVVLGGIHGNEPAGVRAAEAVLEQLEQRGTPLRGQLVCLAGNLAALPRNERFLARDLNRRWFEEDIARLLASDPALLDKEDAQQRELVELLVELEGQATGGLVFLDLHSTSSISPPFCCMADTLRNRRIALGLPMPILFGLEETIDGSIMGYLTERGHTALAVEGGQHDAPATQQAHEASIWLCAVAAGCLAAHEVPDFGASKQRLVELAKGHPQRLEITYRHGVEPGDGFVMRPGFWSFQPVEQGKVLADDAEGEISVPEHAMLLMPLYQSQGEDGFFLAKPMSRFRLACSSLFRRLRLEFLLHLVPGIRSHPDPGTRDAWLVPHSVADGFTRNLLFLFGYRRMRPEGIWVVFTRRRPGFMGRSTRQPGDVADESQS